MKPTHASIYVLGIFFLWVSLAVAQTTKPTEQELIAALKSSETPDAEKALTCKKLAVYGSSASVPVLAPLLADERLASWARIPLEVIPGEEADAAFREAAQTLTGRQLIGTLNSIGVRRDSKAVEILNRHLFSDDADVASAAAVALGRIGSEPAAKMLQAALASGADSVREAAADGAVLCAEHLMNDDISELAAKLYDQVRTADVAKQRLLEATRGAILVRGKAGIPLLLEQLKADDRDFYRIGLSTAREVSGSEATQALVEVIRELNPERQPALLLALADRGDKKALPSIMLLAIDAETPTRLAAMQAVEKLGDVSCVESLLNVSAEPEGKVSAAAKQAIERLPDEKVDAELVRRLADSSGKVKECVIEIIGKRRIEAYPELRKAAEDSNRDIRRAALLALGSTIKLENLDFLIDQFKSSSHTEDSEVAGRALRDASVRMPDLDAAATKLSTALSIGSDDSKATVLKILGEMGGQKALQLLGETARTGNAKLQDAATRLLGEWMTVDASSELIKLAEQPGPYQVRALRGYIRLARQFLMPAKQRTEMCSTALKVAKRDAERKLVLGVLQRYASVENLKLAVEVAKSPTLKQDAVKTVRAIANKLGAENSEVKAALSDSGIVL